MNSSGATDEIYQQDRTWFRPVRHGFPMYNPHPFFTVMRHIMVQPIRFLIAFCLSWLFALTAQAQSAQFIEILGSSARALPLAIANFEGEGLLPQGVTSVVRGDLERSGVFKMVEPGARPIPETARPDFAHWRSQGADALLVGSVLPTSDGRYEVRFRLFDVQKQQELVGLTYLMSANQYRVTGHRISDVVYERLLGERGIFASRIAYVVRAGGRYELQIADADGGNPQSALMAREPIMSPSWSPDGSRLAYVSFETKKPVIYVLNPSTGQRHVVANFKGSNSAPAWSPEGSRLAVVLTKDGGSQIYTVNVDGSGLRRMTTSGAIDTEPRFSPDGRFLYFTSDRGGSPQIYRMPANGGDAERVTFDGTYNVSPRLSPDGQTLAFIQRNAGRFQVAVMDLNTRQIQVLTDSHKDESPSFAPNGRMILLASDLGGRGVLSVVSVDGRIKQRLSISAGDAREPAWAPFYK